MRRFNSKPAPLIANIGTYYENEMNILLIGLHGIGKTISIMDFAKENNIVTKYYSCSTLDPYTDLVGIPIPRKLCAECGEHNLTDRTNCVSCEGHLSIETLQMVRPQSINDAEMIIADELNRADPKVLNAILELVQFRSINGERLPRLKCVWGAINPPNGNYKVEDLDPALVDRFDGYIDVQPEISIEYMVYKEGIKESIAIALMSWWRTAMKESSEKSGGKNKRDIDNFISPRRLGKIARMFEVTGEFRRAIPPGIDLDLKKLELALEAGRRKDGLKTQNRKLGEGAFPFDYSLKGLQEDQSKVLQHLKDNPDDFETQKEILATLGEASGKNIGFTYRPLLEEIMPVLLEGFLQSTHKTKLKTVGDAIKDQSAMNGEVAEDSKLYNMVQEILLPTANLEKA